VSCPEKGILAITGNWKDGELEGKGRLVTKNTTVYEGWFKDSCLHGPVRITVMKKFKTFRQQVSWLGRYRGGVATGQCWSWLEGGGYLTGTVDQAGLFTGDSIAYLYPDLSTALVGIFKDGVMVAAKPARLERVKMVEGIASPVFSILGDQAVSYCLSTEQSVGENPTVPDPYEGRTVQVLDSVVEGGGEGLYAVRNITKGEIVAFYNGVRLPYQPGQSEVWESSGYKIFVNADHTSGERIDLPGDLIHLTHYCATLGHKMNHSFDYNCEEWFADHPRHGVIPCARAARSIRAGEELFLHYGYDPNNCPPWYKQALHSFLQENTELELWEAADPHRLDQKKQVWRDDECYVTSS